MDTPDTRRIGRQERKLAAMRRHPSYQGGANPRAVAAAEALDAEIAVAAQDALGLDAL